MSTSNGGISWTLTSGMQDTAALLPLLGTEQCSVQVSSALTRGYLYAAAAPMSIFGSLGVVIAGFKTLVACFSFGDIEGAKILGKMGFEAQGENLSLIMVEAGKGKNAGRYIIETRMDELIEELNIDKNRITEVSHKSAAWNVKMVAATAFLCAFSIVPYIFLNRSANHLKKSTTWVFPVLRAIGGFTTATLIQILIQQRITTLSNQCLVKRDQLPNTDIEAAVDTKKLQTNARTWLLLFLLLIGLVASVVGYVGCFSVVQNSISTVGPLSWLCLEAGLSVIRLVIWGWSPTKDDAPPLKIILELDEHEPFPTCNKDNADILEYKVLPLTRGRDFLKIITSFAGLIEPFSNPDLSLYYTLTRNRDNADKQKLGEWILYITVFDHKERTTRVYTRDNEKVIFYSTKSDAPLVDVAHFLLEVEIDAEIDDLKGDPVFSDRNILESLQKHHWSILEHIHYRLGATDSTVPYAIENSWTMKVEDTISTLQRLKKNGDDWKIVVEKGREEERNGESLLISDYFMHATIERERRLLDEKRVEWTARRMRVIIKEEKEGFPGGVEYRVDKQTLEKKPATTSREGLLVSERCFMELLLVCEVKEWEGLFRNKLKVFLDQIGKDQEEEKERLMREWRANCWKRLNSQMHAAQKRFADRAKEDFFLNTLGEQWASSISQLFNPFGKPNSISLPDLKDSQWVNDMDNEVRLRREKEIEDTEFRLKRGSDLGRFDQFWDDDDLFVCRYSQSKWLFLKQRSTVPPEIYSHALKGNKNIIHITFSVDSDSDVNRIQATICDLPRVTSIFNRQPRCPPYIDRDLLFIGSTNNDIKSTIDDLIIFAKDLRPKSEPSATYIFTDAGPFDVYSLPDKVAALRNSAKVLISFVAPTSGQNLTLRLKHSGKDNGPLEITLGSTNIQLNPSSKSSLTVDDITLYPSPDPLSRLSFKPGVRNHIAIQFRGNWGLGHGHYLHDIGLLNEAGYEYNPHSASLSKLPN